MLNGDLVRARRHKGELKISKLNKNTLPAAMGFAEAYLGVLEAAVGEKRSSVEEAIDQIPVGARQQKLAAGIRKLLLDRCEFESNTTLSALDFRMEVFTQAARAREGMESFDAFSRRDLLRASTRHLLEQALQEDGLDEERERQLRSIEALDAAALASRADELLFSDLRSEQVLMSFETITPEALVRFYEVAQIQALMLKAERVIVEIEARSAASARAFFGKLKFHRLMHRIFQTPTGFRVEIDGPTSLFVPSTKYGLRLAMMYPWLVRESKWKLEAQIRWGKDRTRLWYRAEGQGAGSEGDELSDDAQKLVDRYQKRKSAWTLTLNREVLSLPGVGIAVPEFVFVHENGERVFVEVLGYWSRKAVWKRVELVEKGLGEKVLFVVPSKLRVSEDVIDEHASGALYVYKGAILPKKLEEKLNALL